MSKELLPQKAMANLAELLGIRRPSTISDVKTKAIQHSDKVEVTVTVTKVITQAQLEGLVK